MKKKIFLVVAALALLVELMPMSLIILVVSIATIFEGVWSIGKVVGPLIVIMFMVPIYSLYVGIKTRPTEIFKKKKDILLFVLNIIIIVVAVIVFVSMGGVVPTRV